MSTLTKNHTPFAGAVMNQVRHKSITVEQKDNGVAELTMHREPSNSWNLEFLEEFCLTLEDLENNRDCRGVIIGSVRRILYKTSFIYTMIFMSHLFFIGIWGMVVLRGGHARKTHDIGGSRQNVKH